MPSPAALPSPFPRKRLPALRVAPPPAPPPPLPPPARGARPGALAARGLGGADPAPGTVGAGAGRWLGRTEPALCPRQPGAPVRVPAARPWESRSRGGRSPGFQKGREKVNPGGRPRRGPGTPACWATRGPGAAG